MPAVARLEPLDRLSAAIPLVSFDRLDIRQPSLVRCLVDSAIAEKMLTHNVKNRRQRKEAVNYIKHQIETGEWRDDHPQPVVFSDAGRLIDGQHRLQAIAESEIKSPDKMLIIRVETGARDDVREYMDTGVPRSLDDRVLLYDDLQINKTIAQLATFNHYRTGMKGKKPSPEDAREFFKQHMDACIFVGKEKKKDKGTGKIQVAYAAMEYYEINKDKASEFYPALFVVDSSVQQARVLRDFLLRSLGSARSNENTQAYRLEVYKKAIGCMKAHLANKKISLIRASDW